MLLVQLFCAHAHQGHKQWNQRRRKHQENTRQPVQPEHQNEDGQGNHHREGHLRQKTGEIAVQRLHVVQPLAGQGRSGRVRQIHRAGGFPVMMQLPAGIAPHPLAAAGSKAGLQPLACGPNHQNRKQGQKYGREFGNRRFFNHTPVNQPGQQHHLYDGRQPGKNTGQNGCGDPALAVAGQTR